MRLKDYLFVAALAMIFTACSEKIDAPSGDDPKSPSSYESALSFFKEINAVPRPSLHEDKMRDYLTAFAQKRNLRFVKDNGNVIIYKDATPGMENVPSVCLQSHMDMVCVAAQGYDIDFLTQGIVQEVDGKVIHSKDNKTSLGADDGIGMSIVLGILDADDIPHGPLECLFTWDEETGMSGALALTPGILESEIMINLDWETGGEMCVGTAGGLTINMTLDMEPQQVPAGYIAYQLELKDATGGHSGADIVDGRVNTISLMAKCLVTMDNLLLVDCVGGDARNAISTHVSFIVLVPENESEDFENKYESYMSYEKRHHKLKDPNMVYSITPVSMPAYCYNNTQSITVINGLANAPQDIIEWSWEVNGAFETSNNIGLISVDDNVFSATYLVRGFHDEGIDEAAGMIDDSYGVGESGCEREYSGRYTAWSPDINSPIIIYAQEAYQKRFGMPIVLRKIGAGLELSEFVRAYPDMQCLAIGPTIHDPHSVKECVEIATVEENWNFVLALLKDIADLDKK